MNAYSLAVLLFIFGILLIAVLALIKRNDQISMRFFLFSLIVCGWGIFYSMAVSAQTYEKALLYFRFDNLFALFIPIFWFHFLMEFVGQKELCKNFYLVNYLLAVCLAFSVPSNFFIKGLHAINGLSFYPIVGALFYIYNIHFYVLVFLGFFYLVKTYFLSVGQIKSQLKYFIIANLIGFLAGGSVFIPAYFSQFPISAVFLMPVYPFFMGIALIRYGLFDGGKIIDAFQRQKLAVLGTMAAGLNHELRNPLYIAKSKIEVELDRMERGLKSDEQRYKTFLDSVYNQLTRALDIMQRFSDIAKPKTVKTEKEKVVIRDIVSETIPLVSHEVEINKIKIGKVPLDGVAVYANRRHMEEIFFNLILNACHAMKENGGELNVQADESDSKVEIKISDTGAGIHKRDIKHIFEPFYTTKKSGTGLGLYIVKELIERNNGTIAVKSQAGRGSTFILNFPKIG